MMNLLTLLDDIATTLDDVAVMTKVAIKKTSALMSDDLAVNAGVVHGVSANRELPIVMTIFLGSLVNKVISILGVLALNAVYPPLLKGVLLFGGLYLSFEGAHKVIEKVSSFWGSKFEKAPVSKDKKYISEKDRIKGAIRTDLILSIEIILIAKSSMVGPITQQVLSLIFVGLAASVLIYGLVAILVKIDDLGLYLVKKKYEKVGLLLVKAMPLTMKGLGIVGTTAMFLVGGGIIAHTFHLKNLMPEILQHLLIGLAAGLLCVVPVELVLKLKSKKSL